MAEVNPRVEQINQRIEAATRQLIVDHFIDPDLAPYREGRVLDWERRVLRGMKMQRGHLVNAILRNADMREAKLDDADLTGTDLSGARLQGASLRNAKLIQANLTDADLTGADLEGADLTGAILDGARLPDGIAAG